MYYQAKHWENKAQKLIWHVCRCAPIFIQALYCLRIHFFFHQGSAHVRKRFNREFLLCVVVVVAAGRCAASASTHFWDRLMNFSLVLYLLIRYEHSNICAWAKIRSEEENSKNEKNSSGPDLFRCWKKSGMFSLIKILKTEYCLNINFNNSFFPQSSIKTMPTV